MIRSVLLGIFAAFLLVGGFVPAPTAQTPSPQEICITRYEWDTETLGFAHWRTPYPDNTLGALDLRSNTQAGMKGTVEGYGLFVLDSTGLCVGGSVLAALPASDLDRAIRPLEKDALEQGFGLPNNALRSITYKGVIAELMTEEADASGVSRWKPVIGDKKRGVEIRLNPYGVIYESRLTGPHRQNAIDVFKADYRRMADSGVPLAERRNFTGRKLIDLFGRAGGAYADQLLPSEHRQDGFACANADCTTISDDFTDSNGTLLQNHTGGLSWTQTSASDITINSNIAECTDDDAVVDYRAEDTLSTDDHEAEIDVTTLTQPGTGDNTYGPTTRYDSSALTYYTALLTNNSSGSDTIRAFKVVTGSFTGLDSDQNITLSIPDNIRMRIDGSTFTSYFNDTEEHNFTDASITGNTRTGVFCFMRAGEPAGNAAADNFLATDVGVAPERRIIFISKARDLWEAARRWVG